MNNGRRARRSTSSLPNAKALYLPINLNDIVQAVVGSFLDEKEIELFEYGIVNAMLNEAALAFSKWYGNFWVGLVPMVQKRPVKMKLNNPGPIFVN